jgi:hypothetical protein
MVRRNPASVLKSRCHRPPARRNIKFRSGSRDVNNKRKSAAGPFAPTVFREAGQSAIGISIP